MLAGSLGVNLLKGRIKKVLNKKAISTLLAGTLIFSNGESIINANAYSFEKPETTYEEYQAYTGIKMYVNGRFVDFNNDLGYPVVINESTYIPVRAVSEAYNAYISWSQEGNSVYIAKHGKEIKMVPGSDQLYIIPDLKVGWEHYYKTIDKDVLTINNRVYIPLRVIFETFGDEVNWDGNTSTITIQSDYEENTKYIDFKDEKIFSINEIDMNKKYNEILYDGTPIDASYINILKKCDDYKVLEKDETLYIFSHQYLFDLNYMYEAHSLRKTGYYLDKEFYSIFSLSEKEIDYITSGLYFIDGYQGLSHTTKIESDTSGTTLRLNLYGNKEEYVKVDEIVNKIVNEIKNTTTNKEEMVKLVNKKLCDIITYIDLEKNPAYTSTLYTALIDGSAVCDGYAYAFKYIMDKLEIPCIICSGASKKSFAGHAWNQVYINGEWKIVDVTGNDAFQNDTFLLIDEDDAYFHSLYNVNEDKELEQRLTKLTLKFTSAN